MKIRFITPPKELQKGGIENAVEGLRDALLAAGTPVADGPDSGDPAAVHHFHGLWNPAHARLAAELRRAGRPYVVSPHGMLEPWAFRNRWWKKLPYFWLVERRLLLGAGSLFVTSAMERDHLRRVIRHRRVDVLALGCRDVRAPDRAAARAGLGWGENERVMLFLSRLDPKKGLHLLLEALAAGGFAKSAWRLVVVGDGPADYLANLKRQAAALGANLPAIDWAGAVWGEQRWAYLQAADLFCLPTHSENFGIAVLEAFHVGTPVLTTTGTPWVEYRGMDGVFISRPDAPSLASALAEADHRLAGGGWSATDRQRLSAWAGEHFAWSELAGSYQDAYRSLLP